MAKARKKQLTVYHCMNQRIPTTIIPFYLHFIRQWKWPFVVFFCTPLFLIIESVLLPFVLKEIIDIFASGGPTSENAWLAARYIGLNLILLAFMYSVFRFNEFHYCRAMPWLTATIRTTLFDHVKSHSQRFYNDHFAGSISNKVNDVSNSAQQVFLDFNWMVMGPLYVLTASLVVMAQVNATLALVFGVYAVIEISMSLYFALRVNRVSKDYAEEVSTLTGKMVDIFTNNNPMRLFASERKEYLRVYDQQEIARGLDRQKMLLSTYRNVVASFTDLALMAGLLYGCLHYWLRGELSPGEAVFIMTTASAIVMYLFHAGMQLPNLFANIGISQQGLTIVTTPHEMQDAPDAKPLAVTNGAIAFDQVRFHYHKDKPPLFDDLSLRIPAGQKVGLVGFSGSGKTTFVNLILRLYDLQSGKVSIDDQNIANVTQQSLREQIAFIPQDTTLFHRSLMDNIRYGNPNASDEEVMNAAKLAACDTFIDELEDGYETLVGERGVKLSGGQRQRIAIARAILKDAPILILDEATSALDSITEKRVQAALNELMDGRTTIVVAHRLSTLSHMDSILVFKEGAIIEDGNHAELLDAGGHYAKLWHMQLDGFLPEKES